MTIKFKFKNKLKVLQENRNFALYWFSITISSIGDGFIPVTTVFAVMALGGTGVEISIILTALWASRVLFILIGGVWADKVSRKLVLLLADLTNALNHLFIALAFFSNIIEIYYLIISAILYGAAGAFSSPASLSIISNLLKKEELQRANSLLSISKNSSLIFGPAFASILIQFIGYGLIYLIDSVTFLISFILIMLMNVKNTSSINETSFIRNIKTGFKEFFERKWLVISTVAFSIGNMIIAAYNVIGPLVINELYADPYKWGLIVAAGTAGAIAGGFFTQIITPKKPYVFSFSVMGVCVSLLLIGITFNFIPILVVMLFSVLSSGSIALSSIYQDTIVQQRIPDNLLSKVDAIGTLISWGFLSIGLMLSGPVSELIGYSTTLYMFSGLLIIVNLIVIFNDKIRDIKILR